jgi:hypothetical protein
MPRDKRAVDISEDVKLVLGVLNMRYPNFVPGQTIYKAVLSVSTDYNQTRCRRDLSYLNEKGYVKFKGLHGIDAMTININDCAFALTDDGFEVANRLTDDKALDV